MSDVAVCDDWKEAVRLDDPYFYVEDNRALFQQIQREDPVFWYEPGKFWALTKYQDIRSVLAERDLLSNAKGTLINSRGDDWAKTYLEKSGRMTLVFADAPFHSKLKSAMLNLLSPMRLRAMEEHMVAVVNEVLDTAPRHEAFDFAEGYAARLPAEVVASLLDVPRDIMPSFIRWANATRESTENLGFGNWDEVMAALGEMHDFFKTFVAERRVRPADDFVSGLLAIEIDGEKLGDEWILGLCGTLVAAGFESAKNFIMSATDTLYRHPDQRQLLIEDPEIWPNALEELFRFIAPSNGAARYVTRDFELRGKTIRKGDWIVALYGAGNIDEDIWPNALSLDLTRTPRPITTFGAGPHLCLGNMLAKIEARVAIQTLLARYPNYLVLGKPERRASTLSNSYKSMSVILDPLD